MANVGLNVDQATRLFTVVDLSTVWVVADLYETDFSRVRVGASSARDDHRVSRSAAARPRQLHRSAGERGDRGPPRCAWKCRTRAGELRLGMYPWRSCSAGPAPLSARPAQRSPERRRPSVVYLVNPANRGQFVEREVRLGALVGEQVVVLAGLRSGDVVVSQGSFSVRAERERLGLRPGTTPAAAGALEQRPDESVQTAKITVGVQGYEPARVNLRAGVPARLTFVRTTDKTCGTEIVFPSLNINRALPLNQAVVIEFTPSKAGDIAFACGMNMLQGVVVVSDR